MTLPAIVDARGVPELQLYDVMCVDPGLGGTGIAFWPEIKRGALAKATPPSITAAFLGGRGPWQDKLHKITDRFRSMVNELYPSTVVIEFQELWTGSAVSMAAGSSGDLFKLTYLTGFLGRLSEEAGAKVELVTPGQWKGQLSKKAVGRRIARALGAVNYPDHTEDAVGIGLTVQGVL